jgi:Double-GTPase 2
MMTIVRNIAPLFAAVVVAVALLFVTWVFMTVAVAGWLPILYFSAMRSRIGADPGGVDTSIFAGRKHLDEELAFAQYFLGPVFADFVSIVADAIERQKGTLASVWTRAAEVREGGGSMLESAAGTGIAIGIVVGAVGGVALTSVIALIHGLIAIFGAIAAVISAMLLRGADTLHRYLAGVHMTCPDCVQAVRPYAAYRCPSCYELHRDIRPGRRGILQRVCTCGGRLPTLLLVGAFRLTAVCPKCGATLPSRFGKAPEVILPVFGSVKSGKTRLIYMLVLAIQELVISSGGIVELDEDTKDEINRIAEQLSITGSPSPTVPKSPEAFVLRVKLGLGERYIFLFDAAGELHYRDASLDTLRYLEKANTLIYVCDPLAADGVWNHFTDAQQDAFAAIRSDWSEAELAYELSRDQVRRFIGKRRPGRLAFVVTKGDVLADAQILDPSATVRGLVYEEAWMNMGNVVREAEHSFGQVEYFKTAAIESDSGSVDASVAALASWLLSPAGIQFSRRSLARKRL